MSNHNISANDYADKIEQAIEMLEKLRSTPTDYEKRVQIFYEKGVEMHKVNRLHCLNKKICKQEIAIRQKANKKIRAIIRVSELELKKLQDTRKTGNLNIICDKYNLNIETIRKIIK